MARRKASRWRTFLIFFIALLFILVTWVDPVHSYLHRYTDQVGEYYVVTVQPTVGGWWHAALVRVGIEEAEPEPETEPEVPLDEQVIIPHESESTTESGVTTTP